MKKFALPFLMILTVLMSSCDLEDIVPDDDGGSDDDANIAEGLKEALRVGTDTAVSILAIEDGYFRDEAVKILLPDDVESAIASFKSKSIDIGLTTVTGEQLYTSGFSNSLLGVDIPSLQDKEDDLILGINRAAENAANDAKPIFVDAITGMTISDATDILFGEDTAATHFLRENTYSSLYNNYEPEIDSALLEVTIGETSVVQTYEDFVSEYNDILNTSIPTGLSSSTVGELMGINTIAASDLSDHATTEGLDGLFLKVSEEEQNIRVDPLARVTDLLVSVFSKLDD